MIKDDRLFKIVSCFGAFICFLLLCSTIYFTPNFLAKHLSPDGILAQDTISAINLFRIGVVILGAIGFLISTLCIINPSIFIQFYSIQDQIWKKELKLVLFFFPIVFVICAVVIKNMSPYWYEKLILHEDSITEWLQFIFYFLAFIISFSISITYYKSDYKLFALMYMLLAIGLFLIAMEEISWGQRIFNKRTPAFFMKYNYQHEINLHNIEGFPLGLLYIIVGFYGAFSRLIIPKKVKTKYRSIVDLFIPDYYLFFYFFVVGALYFYYVYLSSILVSYFGDWAGWGHGHFIVGKDQEPAEFLLSCGFLMFVVINKYRQVSNKNFGLFIGKRQFGKQKIKKGILGNV